MLTTMQAYENAKQTFVKWVNWEGETDLAGLLIGLGDYYSEIRIIEDELGIPESERFDVRAAIKR